jgi:hypothetical protein
VIHSACRRHSSRNRCRSNSAVRRAREAVAAKRHRSWHRRCYVYDKDRRSRRLAMMNDGTIVHRRLVMKISFGPADRFRDHATCGRSKGSVGGPANLPCISSPVTRKCSHASLCAASGSPLRTASTIAVCAATLLRTQPGSSRIKNPNRTVWLPSSTTALSITGLRTLRAKIQWNSMFTSGHAFQFAAFRRSRWRASSASSASRTSRRGLAASVLAQ